ncbi:MAG TPA: DUF4965 domain-containing protein [Gemmataceae bacterium]|nr:DUF4965 domain-containing protein [Gemmataceae bacterium]
MRTLRFAVIPLLIFAAQGRGAGALPPFRPPAVPLVACDPYFSIWSAADRLTDDATRHWTGKKQALTSLVRIDGKTYRLMGDEPKEAPPLPQVGLQVWPTRTIYDFQGAWVQVTLTFTTPALPDDLDVLSRPLTYLTWDVRSVDGRDHAVGVYFSDAADLAVNEPSQRVVWSREEQGGLTVLGIGSEEQPVLQKKGDDLRIDWGHVYAAAAKEQARAANAGARACTRAFIQSGELPADDRPTPRAAGGDDPPVSALVFNLGDVGAATASRHLLLAYDDEYSIEYFGRKLRPYWRRNGASAADLLQQAEKDYKDLQSRCKAFDEELTADLRQAGGEKYARLAALAYRQTLAANKLTADANGQPLLFPKENFSNGCIATVDVIYPMDPFFLLFSPTLAKASLAPVLNYAASERWKFPFAPHDLGTYPRANGQVYGGGERTEQNQMPVEESGNLLLLLAALAHVEGNADFAGRYWPQATRWAEYLAEKGFDPEKQLCTDDFAGHLAHNVNLSVKAIEALAAYGRLCEMRGDAVNAAKYHKLAAELAAKWVKAADDGDHFRLAFDRPDTWSQKYNLVWDRILDFKLFPPEVSRKEIAFYRKHMNRYGLPLDNRKTYTKLDWTIWTATLAESPEDFEALADPVYDFLQNSPSRVPMTDWYATEDGTKVGFQARSVVGGVFIKLMADPAAWKKWSGRDKTRTGEWAPLPKPPVVKEIVPTSRREPATWRYTISKPADGWQKLDFDAKDWKEGPAGFGTTITPGAVVRTEWKTDDIWIRREFTLPEGDFSHLQLLIHHDDDAEVYINGVLAASLSGYTTDYEPAEIRPAARTALKPGKNVLAVHCRQIKGGQYIDAGIVEVMDADR